MAVNIVIFDQVEAEVEFLAQLLTESGYQVICTDKEFDLLEIIDAQHPALILINASIKDMDSYLICKKIKLLEKGKNIPIIFINRDQDYFEPEKMFHSGGVDYLNYPCSEIEVLTRIKTQLKIKDLELQLQQKNNQYFNEVLKQEWLRCSRERISFSDLSATNISLILGVINDFAQYQENYEKELAENCLKMVAENISNNAKRPADLVVFYEPEKFAVLLPNTDQEGAKKVAHIIQKSIQELQIPHPYSSISEYITLTMGVATGIPTPALPAQELFEVAEQALAQALKQGGEAIVIDSF